MTQFDSLQTKRWLAGLIDYAGLFPPAALDMAGAAAAYAQEVASQDAWMLGRFVVPAARLDELAAARVSLTMPAQPWRVSAVLSAGIDEGLTQVRAFNARQGTVIVGSIEARAESFDTIDRIAGEASGFETYVEIPLTGAIDVLIERIAARGLRAKVRTGGVSVDAFPEPGRLASFLAAVVRAGLAFKATAGLHHPLRGEYPLTYADNAERGTMYGYLNLLLATAAVRAQLPGAEVERLLVSRDASTLVFEPGGVRWRDLRFTAESLGEMRRMHLVSIGSCSFREPVDELRALTSDIR